MDAEELMRRLAAALAIGLLVGTERHWRERQEAAGRRTAGVRTFALTGLLGGVMAVLASALGEPGGALLLGFGLAALLAAQLPFALREAEAENRVSATSLVAALGTYGLGALAVLVAIGILFGQYNALNLATLASRLQFTALDKVALVLLAVPLAVAVAALTAESLHNARRFRAWAHGRPPVVPLVLAALGVADWRNDSEARDNLRTQLALGYVTQTYRSAAA
jgi:hypothetical protein